MIELYRDNRIFHGKSNICGVGNTLFVLGYDIKEVDYCKFYIFNLVSKKKIREFLGVSKADGKIYGITCSETHLFIVF